MKTERLKLAISGMTCEHCAITLENLLKRQQGVSDAKVNFQNGTAEILFNPDAIKPSEIESAINKTKQYKSKIMSCCNVDTHRYELIIIGGGSAAFAAAIAAHEKGLRTLMINSGLPIGGTCVNVGCLPSKYLIRAAESIFRAHHTPFAGIHLSPPSIDFQKIIQEKKNLVQIMRQKKYTDVVSDFDTLQIIEGHAEFLDPKTVRINQKEEYTADKFLIATGSATAIPPIKGLEEIPYFTNDTLFDLEELPESLIIIGGGYIGLEIAQAYKRFGSKVTIIEFADRVLNTLSADVSEEITKHLQNEGIEIYTNTKAESVNKHENKTIVSVKNTVHNTETCIEGTHLLVATGRKPNTQGLGLENAGIATLKSGHILVNEYLQTSVPHIYAAGDCNQNPPFVYTAAYEGNLAVRNITACCKDEQVSTDYYAMPWVIFTDPQIGGIGIDEAEATQKNIPYQVSVIPLSEVPRCAVAFDTRGFIKLLRNPENDQLIGARIVAPEAGELLMELSLAMRYKIPVTELKNMLHPYLTLSEGIKLAAIAFGKDVKKLSCCAV